MLSSLYEKMNNLRVCLLLLLVLFHREAIADQDMNQLEDDEFCDESDPDCKEFYIKSIADLEERFKEGGDIQKFISERVQSGESSNFECTNSEIKTDATEKAAETTISSSTKADSGTPTQESKNEVESTTESSNFKAECRDGKVKMSCTVGTIQVVENPESDENCTGRNKFEHCCDGCSRCRVKENCENWNETLGINYDCNDKEEQKKKRRRRRNNSTGRDKRSSKGSNISTCSCASDQSNVD